MRYRIQLRIREDTGEVELFQVDTVGADPRAAGHNAAHHRVATEVAGLLENDAVVEEIRDPRATQPVPGQVYRPEPAQVQQLPPETHSG